MAGEEKDGFEGILSRGSRDLGLREPGMHGAGLRWSKGYKKGGLPIRRADLAQTTRLGDPARAGSPSR
ncbi:MAG: hypothetical protein ACK53L_10285, partial [Pirellulaceae bacterium]